jgi:hypothetical protein
MFRAKIHRSWSPSRLPPLARTRCLLFRLKDSEGLVTAIVGVLRDHERFCFD